MFRLLTIDVPFTWLPVLLPLWPLPGLEATGVGLMVSVTSTMGVPVKRTLTTIGSTKETRANAFCNSAIF